MFIVKRIGISLVLILLAYALADCSAPPPCDERIEDRQQLQYDVMSNPLIEHVSKTLHMLHVFTSECYIDGKAQVIIRYALLPEYSKYGFIYTDNLYVSYLKTSGEIEIENSNTQETMPLRFNAIIDMFKNRVNDIKSAPRVQEFLANIKVETSQYPISLGDDGNRATIQSQDHRYRINYILFANNVRGYFLPNNITWHEFPEIQRAHEIIVNDLLIGDLSNCNIDYSDELGYTSVDFHDFDKWYITVSVVCPYYVHKLAWVQLNADNSYERLKLQEP